MESSISRVSRSKKIKIRGVYLMRRIYLFLIISVISMVLIACEENENSKGNASSDTEEFKVGYMPNYASMNSVMGGLEAGSFEEQGLEIELVEFEDGPNIISAMESGSIDAGYIGPGAHVLPVEGEAKIITFSHLGNADEVIGNADSGVESIQDLEGKKVGMASGTSSETILELALKDADMSKDDLELVDMDASAVVTAMTSGGVDAAATWSPNTNTIKEELGDDAIKLAENADYAEEFPSIASWVVAPSYAEENADKIEKFTKGLYEGMDYHIENTDEVVEKVAEQSAIDVEAVEEQTGDGDWKKSDEILELLEEGTIQEYYEQQQENFIDSDELESEDEVDIEEYLMIDNMEKALE